MAQKSRQKFALAVGALVVFLLVLFAVSGNGSLFGGKLRLQPLAPQLTQAPTADECKELREWYLQGVLSTNYPNTRLAAGGANLYDIVAYCKQLYPQISWPTNFPQTQPAAQPQQPFASQPTPGTPPPAWMTYDFCKQIRSWVDQGVLTQNLGNYWQIYFDCQYHYPQLPW